MFKRREFLKAAGSSMVIAASSPAWLKVFGKKAEAASGQFTNLTAEEGSCVLAMAHTLMPTENEVIKNTVIKAATGLDAAAGSSPDTLKMYKDGIKDLNSRARKAGDKDFADLPPEKQTEVLKSIEGSPLFGAVYGGTVGAVFADHEVWKAIGYPGPSHETGGYLNKGFDKLEW